MPDSMILRYLTEGIPEARTQVNSLGRDVKLTGDDAEVAGRKFDKGFGLATGGIRKLAAYAGATGLAFGLKDAVGAGMKLQSQQVALQQTLKTTRGAGVDAYGRITTAAEKASTAGGFSTEENLSSANAFLHETHNVSESLSAMSAATDLARAKGWGLAQAQMVVQRALTGSTTGINRYVHGLVPVKAAEEQLAQAHGASVIQWEAQAEAMNKASAGSGTQWLRQIELAHGITKAQAEQAVQADKLATAQRAMGLIGEQYGGQQAKYAKTAQGRAESMQNAYKNLSANIGEAFLPVVDKVMMALTGAAKWMDKNRWAAYALMGVVTALGVTAFGKTLVTGVQDATKGIKGLGNGAKKAAGWVLGLGAADDEAAASATGAGVASDVAAGQLTIFDTAVVGAAESAAAGGVAIDAATAQLALFDVAATEGAVATTALDAALGVLLSPIVLVVAAVVALGVGIYELVKHFKAVEAAAAWAWHGIESGAADVWHWIEGHWKLMVGIIGGPIALAAVFVITHFKQIEHFVGGVWHDITHGAAAAGKAIVSAFKTAFNYILKNNPISGVVNGIKDLSGGHFGRAAGSLLHGATFGLLNQGGAVESHGAPDMPGGSSPTGGRVKHLYTGGPAGTDTVEGWLTPGEGVVSRAGMAVLGEQGLSQLNTGMAGGGVGQHITLQPGVVNTYVQIDGKVLAKAVTSYVLKKAARGPSSLVGGSLATGKV